jgi:hypothetical protein
MKILRDAYNPVVLYFVLIQFTSLPHPIMHNYSIQFFIFAFFTHAYIYKAHVNNNLITTFVFFFANVNVDTDGFSHFCNQEIEVPDAAK